MFAMHAEEAKRKINMKNLVNTLCLITVQSNYDFIRHKISSDQTQMSDMISMK